MKAAEILESKSKSRLEQPNTLADAEVMDQEVRLAIGIPLSWPFCHSDFFDSFTLMKKPIGTEIIRAQSGPIQEMRNTIAKRALASGCTHLLFLDADMVYPVDTIQDLLKHNKEIVGALTFKRWPPFNPILFTGMPERMTLIEEIPEGLVEVTATGTGCLLIKCSVFARIAYPWFEFRKTEENNPVGEDINFCYKARDIDIKTYVDCDVKTEHLCQMRVNESLWNLSKALMKDGKKGFSF